MSFFDRLSIFTSAWPIFLVLFLIFFALATLGKEFFEWCFSFSEKEKARKQIFDLIKNGGGNPKQFNQLAKKAGLKFGDDYFNEVENLTIKQGDIILWGVQGMTTWQANQQKESLMSIFPKGCIVFPVWSGEGLLAILTPDKKPVSAVEKAIRREKLLAEPVQQW